MNADVGSPHGLALQRRFMQHVVGIYCDFLVDRERPQVVYTGFLFSVEGRWMLITAGHCITYIEQIRATGGELRRMHVDRQHGRRCGAPSSGAIRV